ncbi:MAG: hypothetical protein U0521_11685 [Anaerolineae bacterium]
MDDFLRRLFGGAPGKPHPLDGDSGLPAPGEEGDLALPAPVQPRVLAIVHNPTIHPRSGQKAQIAYRWNDPDKLAQGYIDDLRHASYGYLDYRIVERIEVDAFRSSWTAFATPTSRSSTPGTPASSTSRTRSIIWRWCANSA